MLLSVILGCDVPGPIRSFAVRLNPGWEFRIYNDTENRKLLEEFYPWFLETYDSYPKIINKVDAIRIFYLAKYGGIYMDLDYTCPRGSPSKVAPVVCPLRRPHGFKA